MKTLKRILNSDMALGILGSAFGVVVALLIIIWATSRPKPVITPVTDKVTTVQVEAKELTPKNVLKHVEDDENVKALLAENKRLKIQVQQLSETLARATSRGSGTITVTNAPTPPLNASPVTSSTLVQTAPVTQVPPNIDFKDWRLHFWTEGLQATYDLTQQFEVLSTTGKNRDGVPVNLVKLFEIGPDGTRTPIETVKTTSVVAQDTRKHWHLSPTLQAGIGLAWGNSTRSQGAIVGIQLMKRGYTKAAEDSSLSILTPVVFLNDHVRQPGILPFSVNLGRAPYQPFKDLWVSPFVGYDVNARGLGKVGVTFTASF